MSKHRLLHMIGVNKTEFCHKLTSVTYSKGESILTGIEIPESGFCFFLAQRRFWGYRSTPCAREAPNRTADSRTRSRSAPRRPGARHALRPGTAGGRGPWRSTKKEPLALVQRAYTRGSHLRSPAPSEANRTSPWRTVRRSSSEVNPGRTRWGANARRPAVAPAPRSHSAGRAKRPFRPEER